MIVTQNVDRLHQKAGSTCVVDLHGQADVVKCMVCEFKTPRSSVQRDIENLNPDFTNRLRLESKVHDMRSDGDANIGVADLAQFIVPCCPQCRGILKPDVVFFGDSVPSTKVKFVFDKIGQSDGVLVVGTSLEVFSAYRFVRRASESAVPIAIINAGVTRAERSALPGITFKSDALASDLLSQATRMAFS